MNSTRKAGRRGTDDRSGFTGRRGFMSGLGASGLTTAIMLFGRTPPAHASHCPPGTKESGCCCLCGGEPGMTWLDCVSCDTHYVWQCRVDADSSCRCCECGNSGGGCSGVTGNSVRCSA